MNVGYLRAFFTNHPVSLVSMRNTFALFFIIGAFLGLLIIFGIFEKAIFSVVNESRAPIMFQLLCSIALIYLSGRVAIKGPFSNLQSGMSRVIGVYFPNTALGFGSVYVGITCGMALPIVSLWRPLPRPYTAAFILEHCSLLLGGLFLLYVFFVPITVNQSVAPGYKSHTFTRNMRVLSALFCIAITGRSLMLLASGL